jgi:hypothetical protein
LELFVSYVRVTVVGHGRRHGWSYGGVQRCAFEEASPATIDVLIEILPVEVGFVRFVGDRPLDSPTLDHIKYAVSEDGHLGYALRESLLGLGP